MKCKLCSETDKSKFYASNKSNCKECVKARVRKHRLDNLEKIKEYDRNRPNAKERNEKNKLRTKEKMKDPGYREKSNKIKRDWLEKNTVKRAAHIIFGNAVRDGKIKKQPCEVCGETKVDGHHDDYEKPLEVRWLCRKHHVEHHKKERERQRNGEV